MSEEVTIPNDDIPSEARIARILSRVPRCKSAIKKEKAKPNPDRARIKGLTDEIAQHAKVLSFLSPED